MKYSELWTEKYRPKCLDDLILDDASRTYLETFSEEVCIPHLMLVGTAGIGKTSLARIIVDDIMKCDHLYINASDENGIDTIRDKVMKFAKTRSSNGGIKVAILDEFDGTTVDGQKCLRNLMENAQSNIRFIITGNFQHKIQDAIASRCVAVNIKNPLNDCLRRCDKILKEEGISYTADDLKSLGALIKRHMPDFRKVINELQKVCATGNILLNKAAVEDSSLAKQIISSVITGKMEHLRGIIKDSTDMFSNDYRKLMDDMFEVIYSDNAIQEHYKKSLMMIVAQHMEKHEIVLNKEINCYACILNMEKSLME